MGSKRGNMGFFELKKYFPLLTIFDGTRAICFYLPNKKQGTYHTLTAPFPVLVHQPHLSKCCFRLQISINRRQENELSWHERCKDAEALRQVRFPGHLRRYYQHHIRCIMGWKSRGQKVAFLDSLVICTVNQSIATRGMSSRPWVGSGSIFKNGNFGELVDTEFFGSVYFRHHRFVTLTL